MQWRSKAGWRWARVKVNLADAAADGIKTEVRQEVNCWSNVEVTVGAELQL